MSSQRFLQSTPAGAQQHISGQMRSEGQSPTPLQASESSMDDANGSDSELASPKHNNSSSSPSMSHPEPAGSRVDDTDESITNSSSSGDSEAPSPMRHPQSTLHRHLELLHHRRLIPHQAATSRPQISDDVINAIPIPEPLAETSNLIQVLSISSPIARMPFAAAV
ncbi:hypothetical protein NX059_010633 [Plenodomus lindquistii]|nr:hypothetical protein NX059_010633 [Plenodomus lindquistii]